MTSRPVVPTSLIRRFKKQYHLARRIYDQSLEVGLPTLQVKFDGQSLSSSSDFKDLQPAVRFCIAMRPFLECDNSIFLPEFWRLLLHSFHDQIDSCEKEKVNQALRTMGECGLELIVNGRELSTKECYNAIATGRFFSVSGPGREDYTHLVNIPLIESLLWHKFFSYNLKGIEVASLVFDRVIALQQSGNLISIPASQIKDPVCVYCERSDRTFKSEEHILPESLGIDELVLPRGTVCDECNNGILCELDQTLLSFEPIAFCRVLYAGLTKDGKLPKANFSNLSFEQTSPMDLKVVSYGHDGFRIEKEYQDGSVEFSFSAIGKKTDWRKLSRVLLKIGIGLVAHDQGASSALSDRYRPARRAIIHDEDFENTFLFSVSSPSPRIHTKWKPLIPIGSPILLDLYGSVFLFGIEPEPKTVLPEEAIDLELVQFDMKGNFRASHRKHSSAE